jgi:hypothetical protein
MREETTMHIFILWHVHELPDEEDIKLIGVYSTRELAEQAQQRALTQPGFCDAPEGFCIDCYQVNKDHWTEGYITQTHEELVRDWERKSEPTDELNAELDRRLATHEENPANVRTWEQVLARVRKQP